MREASRRAADLGRAVADRIDAAAAQRHRIGLAVALLLLIPCFPLAAQTLRERVLAEVLTTHYHGITAEMAR